MPGFKSILTKFVRDILGLRSCHCAKGVVIRNEVAESLALAWENESDMGEVLESLLAVLGESLELEGRPVLLDDVGKCWKMLEALQT